MEIYKHILAVLIKEHKQRLFGSQEALDTPVYEIEKCSVNFLEQWLNLLEHQKKNRRLEHAEKR